MNPTFKIIVDFVSALAEFYPKDDGVMKYALLLKKTGYRRVKKHIAVFKEFCTVNIDGIVSRDISQFEKTDIVYSERIKIDISDKFNDREAASTICTYLLYIYTQITGDDQYMKNQGVLTKFEDVMRDLKHELDSYGDNANMAVVMGTLLTSGKINEIAQKFQGSTSEEIESLILGLVDQFPPELRESDTMAPILEHIRQIEENSTVEKAQIDLSKFE